MVPLFLSLILIAAELRTLEGYLFRESDGGPPLRSLTVELVREGRARHRESTRADGSFRFEKVPQGEYTLRARFSDFVITEEPIVIADGWKNFAAVMLPKRWAGTTTFRTVTAERLMTQSDRKLQKLLKEGTQLIAKKEFLEAIRVYEQATAAGAQADVWDGLGLLYLRTDRKNEALGAFERAIELDPKYLFSYAHLGSVYLEARRYKELMVVAQRALAMDSNWLTAHSMLGEAQIGTGDLVAAQKSAMTASQLVRGRAPGPYLLLAKILWARQNCPDARRHLERYLELRSSVRGLSEMLQSLKMLSECKPAK
ncbi:MAG: tetratricopeptide repeat protein [Acidobacteriota bacterium]